MIPALPWVKLLERGLAHVRAKEFDQGLSFLDEAVAAGGKKLAVFPSRTEVLIRLRALDEAIEGGQESVGIRPKPALSLEQDAPRLFRRLAALPDPFQQVILSRDTFVEPDDEIGDQVKHAESRARRLRRNRNVIDYMPPEILVEIGRHVVLSEVEPSSELAFPLIAVSKRWKAILDSDQELWAHVHVEDDGSSRFMDKADALMAKALPRVLWIQSHYHYDLEHVYTVLQGRGSALRELQASIGEASSLDRIWRLLGPSGLQLRHLRLHGPTQWYRTSLRLSLPQIGLPSLRKLVLQGLKFVGGTSFLPMSRVVPQLSTLGVRDCEDLFLIMPSLDGTDRLELPSLARLTLESPVSKSADHTRFNLVAPNLRFVSLYGVRPQMYPSIFFPDGAPPNTSQLAVARFNVLQTLPDRTEAAQIASHLRRMPSITHLTISTYTLEGKGILTALTLSEPATSHSISSPVCPRLLDLDLALFARDAAIWPWESLKQMVRSRSGRQEGTAKLETLAIDDWGMHRDMYHWLKANVDTFRNLRNGERHWYTDEYSGESNIPF